MWDVRDTGTWLYFLINAILPSLCEVGMPALFKGSGILPLSSFSKEYWGLVLVVLCTLHIYGIHESGPGAE